MIISLKWLKEFLDTNASYKLIEETLTNLGLEVESVLDKGKGLSNFLIGKILKAIPHPNANKLQICTVQISESQTLQIICGAQNARAGIFVIVATIGATLPGNGTIIQEAEIRGIKSFGMLCSRSELSLNSAILPEQGDIGIIEMPKEAQIGDSLTKYFDLDDIILTCNVTPNRSDCLSVYGIARELAAAGLGVLKTPKIPEQKESLNVPGEIKTLPHQCTLFSTWHIENLAVIQTPDWLRHRLANVGIKSINAIVDILNYVSHSFGQPMHAYDEQTLDGDLIVVSATQQSNFLAIDEKNYAIEVGDIVATAGNKIVSLAGIIGSKESKVTDLTRKITIEAALFDSSKISNTGRRLAIQTDARYRFERGVDADFCINAAKLAVQMCLDLCGGTLTRFHILDCRIKAQKPLTLNLNKIQNFLGISIEENVALKILTNLGFHVTNTPCCQITPPSWRLDIHNENDLISEIIRAHGYDKIPLSPIPQEIQNTQQGKEEMLRSFLVQIGYTEVITWSFISEQNSKEFGINEIERLKLANPISEDLAYMRHSIVPNLIHFVQRGEARSVQSHTLFEIGPVFWSSDEMDQKQTLSMLKCGPLTEPNPHNNTQDADIFDLKGDIEHLLKNCNIGPLELHFSSDNAPTYLHPKRFANIFFQNIKLGYIGEIHPKMQKNLKFKTFVSEIHIDTIKMPVINFATQYSFPSNYQAVRRDLAFLIDKKCELGPVLRAISNLRQDLIKQINLFDVFENASLPENKKSFAITYTLQAADRTLTESEIMQVQQQIIAFMHDSFKANLRL